MNDIIIHISDLHISDQNNPIGKVNKKTHLITPSENNNKDFLDIFIDKIKEIGEFNNLTQQMINFIFVELWKNYTDD